jgi:Zn-dependent protease with chaperone function
MCYRLRPKSKKDETTGRNKEVNLPLLSFLLVIFLSALFVGKAIAEVRIPETYDTKIGRAFLASEIDGESLVREAVIDSAVTKVLQRLRQADPLPWKVHVAITRSGEVNAYTFGGGYILLPLGMLKFCRTDAELAFVLSHEIAHGILRHVAQKIERTYTDERLQLLLVLSDSDGVKLPEHLIVALRFGGKLLKALGAAIGKATEKKVGQQLERAGAKEGLEGAETVWKKGPGAAESGSPMVKGVEQGKPHFEPPQRAPQAYPLSKTVLAKTGVQTTRILYDHLQEYNRQLQAIPYDHEQELAADKRAVEMMKKSHYDVAQAVSLLERFPQSSAWSSSHPTTKRRIAAIQGREPVSSSHNAHGIRLTQQALALLDYSTGQIDGVAGPNTIRAIEQFQKDRGLEVDGQVSDTLIFHLESALSSPSNYKR